MHPSSAPDQWLAFAVTCPTGAADPGLDVTWFTEDDPRPRPFPLRRLLVPWATPARLRWPELNERATMCALEFTVTGPE